MGDVEKTISFCKSLGGNITKISASEFKKSSKDKRAIKQIQDDDEIFKIIPPKKLTSPKEGINSGNSGTTIRIMTALASLIEGKTRIFGEFFQRGRPIEPLLNALQQVGIETREIEQNGKKGIEIISDGIPRSNLIQIRGDISSQFITALLFLSPHLSKGRINKSEKKRNSKEHIPKQFTEIKLTTPAKSYPYLKITEDVLESFYISILADFDESLQGRYKIPPDQEYKGIAYQVPGDFSSMAFMIVATALNKKAEKVKIRNLDVKSPQGDKALISLVKRSKGIIEIDEENNEIIIIGGKDLEGFTYDCSQTPDLFPILSVLATQCSGETQIINAEHVRNKETDRISVMVRELRKMGIKIEEKKDGISVNGPQELHGSDIVHDNDHRVAMALTIAALFADRPSYLNTEEIVKDSYPTFFEDLKKLGVKIELKKNNFL